VSASINQLVQMNILGSFSQYDRIILTLSPIRFFNNEESCMKMTAHALLFYDPKNVDDLYLFFRLPITEVKVILLGKLADLRYKTML
jgi:hypothetical protein